MVKFKIIVKKKQRFKEMLSFFIYSLAAHGQLWAIIEGIVSLTQCWSLVLLKCRPEAVKPGRALSRVWTRSLPIQLQPLKSRGYSPQVGIFKMIWFVVSSLWEFLAYLLYFQMKPQLLIIKDIFKLNSRRHKSAKRLCIW